MMTENTSCGVGQPASESILLNKISYGHQMSPWMNSGAAICSCRIMQPIQYDIVTAAA